MSICIKDQIKNMNLVIGCSIGCPYCYARMNVQRFRTTEDFNEPVFFEQKLRLLDREKPGVWLLTGMSDLSSWKPEWIQAVFEKLKKNPQHQVIFLTKRPELLDIDTDLDNAWFGVTVTRRSELSRLKDIHTHVRAKHYHATFELLFEDIGEVNLDELDWIVVGTMTGAMRRTVHTEPAWANSLTAQAQAKHIPVFMKEDLIPIMGEDRMIQEFPEAFCRCLGAQKTWMK